MRLPVFLGAVKIKREYVQIGFFICVNFIALLFFLLGNGDFDQIEAANIEFG